MTAFLGYPSSKILDSLRKRFNIESTKQVQACNPNGSSLTDLDNAEWLFSDGQIHTLHFEPISDTTLMAVIDGSNPNEMTVGDKTYSNLAHPATIVKDADEGNVDLVNFTWYNTTEDGSVSDEYSLYCYRKIIPQHIEKKVDGEWIWDESSGEWSDWHVSISIAPGFDDGEFIGRVEKFIDTTNKWKLNINSVILYKQGGKYDNVIIYTNLIDGVAMPQMPFSVVFTRTWHSKA